MKKIVCLLLVFALLLGTTACGTGRGENREKSLAAHGMDIVEMLLELTRSKELIGVYTASSEIRDILLELGEKAYDVPEAIYAVTVPKETLLNMAELNAMEDTSEELKNYLTQRVMASLISQINASAGVESLAVASVCTIGKTFVSTEIEQNVIYIYAYKNAAPAAVTFTVGEDHTVSASGTFILYDGFACGSAEEIRSMFQDISVDITEISTENRTH